MDLKKQMGNCPNIFLKEIGFSTTNNAKMVSINEYHAKSLIDKYCKEGYIVISPCRGCSDFNIDITAPNKTQLLSQANKPLIQDMIKHIKDCGFSYTPVFGGFVENQGEDNEEVVYERSFIIYPYDRQGKLRDFSELREFGIELAKIYNQDYYLVKASGEPPCYIKKDGSVDSELDDSLSFTDFAEKYFTDLHKNINADSKATKSTRFTYFESCINPRPSSYNESYKRYIMGEKALSYMR